MGAAGPRRVVLDSGALIAFDRGDARLRALVRLAEQTSTRLLVPAAVLAQVWRDPARHARLAALMGSGLTDVVALDEAMARAAGALCGRSGTSDVVDATVVLAARLHGAVVLTSDPRDLRRIDASLTVEVV